MKIIFKILIISLLNSVFVSLNAQDTLRVSSNQLIENSSIHNFLISANYPSVQNFEPASHASHCNSKILFEIEKLVREFKQRAIEASENSDVHSKSSLTVTYKIYFQVNGMLSCLYEVDDNILGTSTTYFLAFNYDLKQNQKIQLENWVSPEEENFQAQKVSGVFDQNKIYLLGDNLSISKSINWTDLKLSKKFEKRWKIENK